MNFKFSWKISVTCGLVAVSMLAASRWQWHRHLEKLELIRTLKSNLEQPPIPLADIQAGDTDWGPLTFRRVSFSGTFDFEHEIILRNRSFQGRFGVHVLTPLALDGTRSWVLVDRGFIPLGREASEFRIRYQKPARFEGFGLIKESVLPKFLGPRDPKTGAGKPWADEWLRVHVAAIQQQLPYTLLPVYLEILENPDDPLIPEKIVKESGTGRDDMLVFTGQRQAESFGMETADDVYPIPAFSTETPPDIHLGYVWEWAFMAVLTVGIGFVLQFRRAATAPPASVQHTIAASNAPTNVFN